MSDWNLFKCELISGRYVSGIAPYGVTSPSISRWISGMLTAQPDTTSILSFSSDIIIKPFYFYKPVKNYEKSTMGSGDKVLVLRHSLRRD